MPNIKKIIEKMKLQSYGIRCEEVEKVLVYGGYHCDRQKGAHMQFINDKRR